MPHIVVEYSDNLPDAVDAQALVEGLHETLTAQGVDAVRIKSRAEAFKYYSVADKGKDGMMVHVVMSWLAGRGQDMTHKAGEALYDFVCGHVKPHAPDCKITLEIREMAEDLFWM